MAPDTLVKGPPAADVVRLTLDCVPTSSTNRQERTREVFAFAQALLLERATVNVVEFYDPRSVNAWSYRVKRGPAYWCPKALVLEITGIHRSFGAYWDTVAGAFLPRYW